MALRCTALTGSRGLPRPTPEPTSIVTFWGVGSGKALSGRTPRTAWRPTLALLGRRSGLDDGDAVVDLLQEIRLLRWARDREPNELITEPNIREDTGRVVMKVQECVRPEVEDTRALFLKGGTGPQVCEQTRYMGEGARPSVLHFVGAAQRIWSSAPGHPAAARWLHIAIVPIPLGPRHSCGRCEAPLSTLRAAVGQRLPRCGALQLGWIATPRATRALLVASLRLETPLAEDVAGGAGVGVLLDTSLEGLARGRCFTLLGEDAPG